MLDIQAISDLQTTIDTLNAQVSAIQAQIAENEQKIQCLRLIADSVDRLEYDAVKVKQAVASVYDVKTDKWAAIVDTVLDDKQKDAIKVYATRDLITAMDVVAVKG